MHSPHQLLVTILDNLFGKIQQSEIVHVKVVVKLKYTVTGVHVPQGKQCSKYVPLSTNEF